MAKSEKQSTELVTFNDISEGFEALKALKDKVKNIQESVYNNKTGQFDSFNIQSETDIKVLVTAYSSILKREEAYNEAQDAIAKKMGGALSVGVFKIEGNTAEEWLEDIVLRINLINNKELLDDMKSMEADLKSLMTNEDKKKELMKRMTKLSEKLGS